MVPFQRSIMVVGFSEGQNLELRKTGNMERHKDFTFSHSLFLVLTDIAFFPLPDRQLPSGLGRKQLLSAPAEQSPIT